MHLRHRLEREAAVLAPLQPQPVLAQRLVVVALLAEGEPKVVVRQRVALDDRRLGRLALPQLAGLPLAVVALERAVGLRAREWRLELVARRAGRARPLVAPPTA